MESIRRFNVHSSPVGMDQSALLVIDMQNYFLGSRVASLVGPGKAILPNVRRLIDHYQENGRPVIYTRHVHAQDGSDLGILGQWWDENVMEGTEEAEIHESLTPRPDEKVIVKNRYSAFCGTDLEEILSSSDVREVVISGVMTNICCESTAREAFFRDIWVKFVADATTTVTEAMHIGALLNLAYAFAEVCLTEDTFRRSSE